MVVHAYRSRAKGVSNLTRIRDLISKTSGCVESLEARGERERERGEKVGEFPRFEYLRIDAKARIVSICGCGRSVMSVENRGGRPGKGRAMIAAPVWIWRNDDKRRDKVVVATPANKIALIIEPIL